MNTHFPHSRVNYYDSMHDFIHMCFESGKTTQEEFDSDLKILALQEQTEREAYYKENNSE